MKQHASVGAGGTIGIVGLGNIGGRIARRIVAAGHDAIGFDADPRRIGEAGVRRGDSVAAVAHDADVLLLSLPDSPVVEAVVLGDDGILAHGRERAARRRPDDGGTRAQRSACTPRWPSAGSR